METAGVHIFCGHCAHSFLICRSCYRGHRYCSEPCRESGYRARRRAARQRHESSPEGRQDHRDRQQEYRDRKKNRNSPTFSMPSVPDKGIGCEKIPLNPAENMLPAAAERQTTVTFGTAGAVCSRCGCGIFRIYGGSDEFTKKARQPRDE